MTLISAAGFRVGGDTLTGMVQYGEAVHSHVR